MKRFALLSGLVLVLLAGGGCGDDGPSGGEAPTAYFGYLLGAKEFAAVAFDVGEPREDGTREVWAYVCDGLGPPEGMALWFAGAVDERAVNEVGRTTRIASVSGQESLGIGAFTEHEIRGTFTDRDGRRLRYIAYPARDGAGIYEVTVDRDLRYEGTSTDGSTLSGRMDRKGDLRGTVKPVDGEEIDFFVQNNALASDVRLSALGLTSSYRRFARNSRQPGQYVAVISPGATHWFGRSGQVRKGSPGASIIGLDKSH